MQEKTEAAARNFVDSHPDDERKSEKMVIVV